MFHDWSWGMGMGWGYGGIILITVVVAAVIVGLVFLIRWISGRSEGSDHVGEDAIDILKKRYARGEISRDEYQRMKEELE